MRATQHLNDGGSPQLVFEVAGARPVEDAPELLGLWTTRGAADGERRFAEAPVWRVEVSGDPKVVAAELSGAEARLARSPVTLSEAEDRLGALVAARSAMPAFDTAMAVERLARPEVDLLRTLQEIDGGANLVFAPGADTLAKQARGLVDHLMFLLAHYAWAETQTQEQLVARTAINWGGDVETIWTMPIDPVRAALHQ